MDIRKTFLYPNVIITFINNIANNEEGYKLRKNLYKNSIYFMYIYFRVHFCTPDDALVLRNILSFYIQILSQFVKPPSDTLFRYFNMFHLVPSPSSLHSLIWGFVKETFFYSESPQQI
jgi:hypothetical protein